VTPTHCCWRMRSCKRRTMLPMRCARRRKTHRRRWRRTMMMMATMVTVMRRRRMTFPGMSWHVTTKGHPRNPQCQHKFPRPYARPGAAGWMRAWRRQMRIATPCWELPCRWGSQTATCQRGGAGERGADPEALTHGGVSVNQGSLLSFHAWRIARQLSLGLCCSVGGRAGPFAVAPRKILALRWAPSEVDNITPRESVGAPRRSRHKWGQHRGW
jgi:hypothetical protein